MRRIQEFIQQIQALFRGEALTRRVDAEIEQHLEFMIADFIRDGMSSEEARNAAHRKFGNVALIKEDSRDSWGTRAILDSLRNIRFGLRLCVRYPGTSIFAVVVLSLGVAIATMMFTLSIKLLDESSGAALDDRDVSIEWALGPEQREPITSRDFVHLRNEIRSLEFLVGTLGREFWIHRPAQPEIGKSYRGVLATPNLFELTDAVPLRGRLFDEQDAHPSAERVILISHKVWADLFAKDETALGSILSVDGQDYRVIGIMPAGFAFPGEQQLWVPANWELAGLSPSGADLPISVAGRLKQGVSRYQAEAELQAIAANLAAASSQPESGRQLLLSPYRDQFIDDDALAILMLGVFGSLLVLSFSCANAFQIIMVRTARRSHELAVRCSLGARRSHVITQVVVDGVTLSMIGTALGLVIAAGGLHFITSGLRVFGMPGLHTFQLQHGVILFALGAGLFAGIASSIVPAWRASRIDSFSILKDDSKSSSSIFVGTLAKVTVAAQVTFSAILLFLSFALLLPALMIDSLVTPYDQGSILTAEAQLRADPQIDSPEKLEQLYRQLRQRLISEPGVRAVALSSAPFGLLGRKRAIRIEGIEQARLGSNQAMVSSVTPDFLEVFGLEPVSGRMINAFDVRESMAVCVIDTHFAATYFPNENPIGRRVDVSRDDQAHWVTIVGIVPSMMPHLSTGGDDVFEQVFNAVMLPYAQAPAGTSTILLSAPDASAYRYRNAIRESLREFAPMARIRGSILTIDERLSIMTRMGDRIATAGILFGGAIFLVSVIGLYAVISFTTVQRRKEFGIRIAVGARGWGIAGSVIKPWAPMVATGLVLGTFCTVGLLLLQAMALGSTAVEGTTGFGGFGVPFVFVALTICVAGLIAAGVPAWQATRVNPMEVIRTE